MTLATHEENTTRQRRQNIKGQWYTVGELTGERKYGRRHLVYEIIFDSGYHTTATKLGMWRGKIRDKGAKSVCGVGITGWRIPNIGKHPLYKIWQGILMRYLHKGRSYEWYKDVTIHPRWLRFDDFVEDAESLPGYDLSRITLGQLQLYMNKLENSEGKREYGPETCCWLNKGKRVAFRREREHTKAPQCPFRGVHWTDGVWLARVQISKKRILVGYYKNPLEAAISLHRRFPDYYMDYEKAQIREAVKESGMSLGEVAGLTCTP